MCNSLSDCKGMQGLYGSRSYGTGKWEKNGYARAFSQLRTYGGWGKSKKISTTTNKIWLFSMPDSSLSRGTLLGRAYSVDNQGLGDSYEVLCPLKFRRSLHRALALNFRRLVPGKPPYPGAWPLNFRGYCPESHPNGL